MRSLLTNLVSLKIYFENKIACSDSTKVVAEGDEYHPAPRSVILAPFTNIVTYLLTLLVGVVCHTDVERRAPCVVTGGIRRTRQSANATGFRVDSRYERVLYVRPLARIVLKLCILYTVSQNWLTFYLILGSKFYLCHPSTY